MHGELSVLRYKCLLGVCHIEKALSRVRTKQMRRISDVHALVRRVSAIPHIERHYSHILPC